MPARDPDEPALALGHADTVTPGLADTELPEPVAVVTPATRPESPQIGERPAADPLARAVARTRIANQLFAKQDRVQLGRYQLLEQVGAGGMGVVWGAWDPELERRVAIKLIKATLPAARDRIQIEGQALARLSHPNVVTVHDVGVVDDQIDIVMEWVRGQNLRPYCRARRSLGEIVAIYRAAGEGLAAAHAEGLIHRDFKPDNAIRGDDGRVRVLDFGLARSDVRASDGGAGGADSSELTRGAGTPRYMPPEQAAGGPLTAAVDQYAFCASLREALAGRDADGEDADIPGWIGAILARGTAPEPDAMPGSSEAFVRAFRRYPLDDLRDAERRFRAYACDRYFAAARFPAMTELPRALGRDPAKIWRRRLIAVTEARELSDADQVPLFASDRRSHDRDLLAVAWTVAQLVDFRNYDRLRSAGVEHESKSAPRFSASAPDRPLDEDQIRLGSKRAAFMERRAAGSGCGSRRSRTSRSRDDAGTRP